MFKLLWVVEIAACRVEGREDCDALTIVQDSTCLFVSYIAPTPTSPHANRFLPSNTQQRGPIPPPLIPQNQRPPPPPPEAKNYTPFNGKCQDEIWEPLIMKEEWVIKRTALILCL